MFRLEEPKYLLAALAVIVLLALFMYVRHWRKKVLSNWGNEAVLQQMMPFHSQVRQWLKFILIALTILFMSFAWSNPQWGTKREKIQRKGSDVFIALDVSVSMNAKDLAPNRLERSKKFAEKLIEKLKGNRVGVIIFAGTAHIHMPLTIDYSAAKLFIESANPQQILTQGTSFESAIDLAELAFEQDEDKYKALIFISDGENHNENSLQAAKDANSRGMLIFTVGAGTTNGANIPVEFGGYIDQKRDQYGELVRTKINEDFMRQVAESGGGDYYNIISGEDAILKALERRISEVEKREFEERMFDEYESYFWIFIIPAILFLIFEFLISNKTQRILSDKDIFS